MASDLDSLDDLLLSSESAVTRPKVSKFRPKLRPKSAKPPEAPKPLANADSSVVKPSDSSNSGDLVIDEATMTQQKALTEPLKSAEGSQQESVQVDDRTKGRGSEMMASDLDSLNDSILPSPSTEPTVGKFQSKFCPKSAKPSEASTPLVNAIAFVVKPCNSSNSGALIVNGVRSTQDASTGSLKSAEAPLRETVQDDEILDGKVVGTRSSRLGSLDDIYFLPATMDSEPSLQPHRVGDHINLTEAPCSASETNKIHESGHIDQETERHASDISNLESMDIFLSSAATVERAVGEVQQEKYAEGEYAPQVMPSVCASTDVFCGSPQTNMYSEFHAIQDTETHPQSDGMKGNKVHVDSGNSGSEAMEESYRLDPLDAGFFSTENEHFEDHDATFQFDSLPDSSVTWPGDSAFVHSPSREPLTQEQADFVQDPNIKDANIPGSYEDYIATPEISGKNNDGDGKCKFSTVNEDMDVDPPNEVHVAGFGEGFGNSKSRQLRKRTTTHHRVNEPESGAYRDAEVEDEESSGSLFDVVIMMMMMNI
ncbi:hypothetical protein QJS10_CPA01g01219 [Acorus calamus]|uniref:Uncharacterized protein n=1 Tax=Acorus calamus TaxID=4465 RepID=A0AAV9FML3_ACOCL|nr:hypothetical protein QJS10_CPA01g01219 [Acorus calamus]